jgi:hypothetical protein
MTATLFALFLAWGCASDEPAAPKKENPPPDDADVTLAPTQDNTIYDDPDTASNGAGVYMVVGKTNLGGNRRGLIQFDLVGVVAPGTTIDSAVVQMHMSLTQATTIAVTLHKVQASWGEGASDAGTGPGSGVETGPGEGVPAEIGDATWLHRTYDTVMWASPGGDFTGTASATTDVTGVGFYTWTSAQVTADVQDWLDNPGNNHGWILIGNESVKSGKRFETREHARADNRPKLLLWVSGP